MEVLIVGPEPEAATIPGKLEIGRCATPVAMCVLNVLANILLVDS
jgi:hypothetical protein